MDALYLWGSRDGPSGWKQAAKVNCIVLASMSVTLVGCLISATSKVGGIEQALFFYDGDCDGGNVSQVNMVLHLIINVVSTLVVSIFLSLPRAYTNVVVSSKSDKLFTYESDVIKTYPSRLVRIPVPRLEEIPLSATRTNSILGWHQATSLCKS